MFDGREQLRLQGVRVFVCALVLAIVARLESFKNANDDKRKHSGNDAKIPTSTTSFVVRLY